MMTRQLADLVLPEQALDHLCALERGTGSWQLTQEFGSWIPKFPSELPFEEKV